VVQTYTTEVQAVPCWCTTLLTDAIRTVLGLLVLKDEYRSSTETIFYMCGGKMKAVSRPNLQQPVDNGTIRTHRLLILIACSLSLLIFQNYQSACYLSAGANGVESLNVADVKAIPELVRGRRLSEITTASAVNAIAPLDVAPHPLYRRAPPNLPSVLKKAGKLDVTGLTEKQINDVRHCLHQSIRGAFVYLPVFACIWRQSVVPNLWWQGRCGSLGWLHRL
jgi:hypothetical protein